MRPLWRKKGEPERRKWLKERRGGQKIRPGGSRKRKKGRRGTDVKALRGKEREDEGEVPDSKRVHINYLNPVSYTHLRAHET